MLVGELALEGHGPVLEARQRHPVARDRDDVGVVLQARVDERRSEDEVLREALVEMEGWRDPVGRVGRQQVRLEADGWLTDELIEGDVGVVDAVAAAQCILVADAIGEAQLADPTRPWGCPRTSAFPPARHLPGKNQGARNVAGARVRRVRIERRVLSLVSVRAD